MSFERNIENLESLVNRLGLGSQEAEKALVRALNRTIRAVSTLSAREIGKGTGVKVKLIKSRMKAYKATKRKTFASLYTLLFSLPAIILGEAVQTKDGVSVGGHFYPDAFLVRNVKRKSGSRDMILKRVKDSKYPLREMRVSIADSVDLEMSRQVTELEDRLIKNYIRELEVLAGFFK
ncbi:MAG: phage tail protein [Oligoflexales bacterium]